MSRYSKFILDSLKKKFETGGKYDEEGFPDLNYEVGNTSGLDVAPGVPSAMDERIGNLSQRGGSVMEVIINNPSTFQIDKEKMFNVINQLGINISLHSDPSIGFASAYKTQSQGGIGYDPAHQYFTKYLEQFAIFKTEVEKRDDLDFKISRINPHISTSPLPSLTERMEADVGQDPFGFNMNDLTEEEMERRDNESKNIYRNKKFLRRLYHTLFLEQATYPFQNYNIFSTYSDKFDKKWKEAQHQAHWELFRDETNARYPRDGNLKKRLQEKVATTETVRMGDQGITTSWLEIKDNTELVEDIEREIPEERRRDIANQTDKDISDIPERITISTLKEVDESEVIPFESDLRALSQSLYNLDKVVPEAISTSERNIILQTVENAIDKLWGKYEQNGDDRYMSVEGKMRGLQNHLEVTQIRILEKAYSAMEPQLEEASQEIFAGNPEYFKEQDGKSPEMRHEEMIRRIMQGQQFQRQLWMESVIFYQIIPAWMETASETVKRNGETVHKGWKAPEFVWKALVKNKWEDKEKNDNGDKYVINLKDPEGSDYFYLLENNREFQMDVAAASGIAYVWGHYTQKKGHFQVSREKYVEDLDERRTWIDWMNEYGIGVNLEAMPGGPQQLLKIWRPKDIVTAARAVNMTAKNVLEDEEELGGRNDFHPDLDERPAKFTIDLEHTATFGVNPWHEMEELIEQEKNLAGSDIAEEYGVDIDKEKPLAKILRMWHLMRPGMETSQSETLHGPWDRGNTQLYEWLYKMVEAGFCRNPDEEGWLMYEVGGDDRGTVYTARIAMNLIELGVSPDELDPTAVDPSKKEYSDEKEALMARFFGIDKSSYDREWAKIEEHAFDPLEGLLEAEQFDYTWSGQAAIENDNRPQEWMQEEYK